MAIDAVREGWKKDEETATDAIWRHAAVGTTQEMLGAIPFVREFAYALSAGRIDPMTAPYAEIMKTISKTVPDAYKEMFGMDVKRTPIQNYITAFGYVTGFPGMGQLAASSQYFSDVGQGIQRGDTIWEKARGYTFGKSHPGEPLRIPRGRSTRHRR
jgi:hypothetical protein